MHILSVSIASTALALLSPQLLAQERPLPQVLFNAEQQNARFTGIGRLSTETFGQCIATLVDSRASGTSNSGPAYVITSGHCVDQRNGHVVHDQPIQGQVTFNYFVDTSKQRQSYALKRIVWSSMQGSDLALLELDARLDEVMAAGAAPLKLAASTTEPRSVQIIGEPSSIGQGLRLSACMQWPSAFVIEQPWVWRNIQLNDCQGLSKGASGSPVIIADELQVVSVVNSLADHTLAHCAPDTSCTLAPGQPATAIAIPVDRVLGCFKDGIADLSQEHCHLLPGFALKTTKRAKYLMKVATDDDGSDILPEWDLGFTLDTAHYRFKPTTDPLDCENPVGYSGSLPAAENQISEPIGPEPGWHFLCVVGVEDAEQRPSPALMANSLTLAAELLPAGPVPFPEVAVKHLENGNVDVSWSLQTPEVRLYKVKQGSAAKIDCEDPKGFRLLRHTSFEFAASKLPLKICTQGEDIIGQQSAVRTDLIEPRS